MVDTLKTLKFLILVSIALPLIAQPPAGRALIDQRGLFANIPTSCQLGQLYFATDQTAGQNVYGCTTAGGPGVAVWTLQAGGGGTGTPGGATNTIQYNAGSGNFGGFTMSGDCTLVVATGAITCTGGGGITTSQTYYVLPSGSGTTGASTDAANGWNGNVAVSTTVSDANNCTAIATPCLTLQGVETKIHAKPLLLGAIVTIYVADTANTGTDCLAPITTTFTNPTAGLAPFSASEQARAGVYPPSYIYVYGNVSRTGVTIAGNGCGVSGTFSTRNAITADAGTAIRVRGFQFEGFGKTDTSYSAAVAAEGGSALYFEDSNNISIAASHNSMAAAFGAGSTLRLGGTFTISGVGNHSPFLVAFGATGFSWDPLATVSTNTNINNSSTGVVGLFSGVDGSVFYVDRTTWSNTGNNAIILFANLMGGVIYSEAYPASVCPAEKCWAGTNNATGVTYQRATENGFIDADCLNFNEGTCVSTVQPAFHSFVDIGGFVRVYATNAGAGNTQVFTGANSIGPTGCVSIFTNAIEQATCGAQTTQYTGSTSGTAKIGVAAAAGTPNQINLPTATGGANCALVTNGASPQQTSWTCTPTLTGTNFTGVPLTTGVTGLLPHANIASTAVTPGSYTSTNLTVDADGTITAASNGTAGSAGGGFTAYSGLSIALTGTTTDFFPFGGGQSDSTTESVVQGLAPSAANINNFGVRVNTDPGNTNTLVFTVRKNGADTAVTCTITGNGSTSLTCADTAHTFTTAANDLLDIKLVTAGVAAYSPNVQILVQVGGLNSGTGTANTLTKWLTSTTQGNAGATDDGTTLTVTDANFVAPATAGYAPTVAGTYGYDTTQKTPVIGGDTGLAEGLPRVLSVQHSTTDTILCSSVGATTETNFTTQYTLPANFFINNKAVRVTIGGTLIGTSGFTGYITNIKLCAAGTCLGGAAGPAVGTSLPIATLGANKTSDQIGMTFLFQGTAAAGASVNVITSIVGGFTQSPWSPGNVGTVQPIAFATNGALTIQVSETCQLNTGGNSVSLNQMIVEALN